MCRLVLLGNYTHLLASHGATEPTESLIHGDINPIYFRPTGDIHPWLRLYIQSECRKAPTTAARRETPDTIENAVIKALPGNHGL